MSVPLGGFGFSVDVNLASAQANLRRLVQLSQQSARQVTAAFSAAQVRPDTRQAEQAFDRIRQSAQRAQQTATTITVRANVNEAQAGLDRLAQRAREVGNARLSLSVRADGSQQAEQAIGRLASALRAAKAGERIAVTVRADNVDQADLAVKRLTADINAAKAAGARVAINVVTSQTGGAPGGATFLQQARGGFIQAATPGLATGGAAAAGVVAAQAAQAVTEAIVDGTRAGIQYNAMLETSAAQFRIFTGSAGAAEESLARLRRFADLTPFDTEETIRSGAVFAQVAGGNIERMERLVKLAGQLAAVNPNPALGGGLEGATVALREALGGDTTSIAERFNVPRTTIQALKDAGLAGEELAAALVKAAGGSKELVDALGQTFTGRLSTARSHLNDLGAAAARPLFDVFSSGLQRFNDIYDQSSPRLKELADLVGRVGPFVGAGALLATAPGAIVAAGLAGVGVAAATSPTPSAVPTGLGPADAARQAATKAASEAADRAQRDLARQQRDLKSIEDQLDANARAAREVTERYQEQLRPLEAQSRELERLIQTNQAQGREIEARARAAQGPVETRAEVAGTQVALDHERELLDIRHRRAEIAEQIGAAEEAIAQRVAEAQIRSAEIALRGAQDRAQAEREARQETLDGLREEIRGRQEARQAALEGLRELISAQQEQRRDALDGIREEIRARREAVDIAREAAQDASRAAQEAFSDQERSFDRGHSAVMERYRDQIEALREQLDVRRGQSDAERALAALDRQDRERARAERLADARRAVSQATTLRGQQDARRNLGRLEQEIASERKREELQARIAKEKEQAEQRRQAIQDKIAAIERKAREEDRQFQRAKDAREEAFRVQQRAEQAQQRAEERAERERRRAEDIQVRAEEKANREAEKAEQAALRAAEQQARAQERADAAQLRAEEKAAREADRAAEREIRAQERAIAAARDNLATEQAARETERDIGRLARLRESSEIEARILDNRQKALEAIDVKAAAIAAADKTRNEAEAAALADRKAALDDQLATINRNKEAALAGLDEEAAKLTIARDRATEVADQMKRVADEMARAVDEAKKFGAAFSNGATNDGAEAGPTGFSGAPGSNAQTATAGVGQRIAASIRAGLDEGLKSIGELGTKAATAIGDGIAAWLKDDTTTQAAMGDWVAKNIIDPVEKALEIRSPSAKAEGWAASISEGFVKGMAAEERAIIDALESPWIEVDQRFWPEVERKWKTAGQEHARAYIAGWESERLAQKIEDSIEDILRQLRNDAARFRPAGRNAAIQFTNGWCHNLEGMIDCVARQFEWMVANANAYGTQVGAQFSNGFAQTARTSAPISRDPDRGSDPHVIIPIGGECPPGYRRAPDNPQLCIRADEAGSRLSQQPQRRAIGGPFSPGWVLAGEQGPELIRFRQAGAVMPAGLTARALSGAGASGVGNRSTSLQIGDIHLHVSGVSGDAAVIAQDAAIQFMDRIVDAFSHSATNHPTPVSRLLSGAS